MRSLRASSHAITASTRVTNTMAAALLLRHSYGFPRQPLHTRAVAAQVIIKQRQERCDDEVNAIDMRQSRQARREETRGTSGSSVPSCPSCRTLMTTAVRAHVNVGDSL